MHTQTLYISPSVQLHLDTKLVSYSVNMPRSRSAPSPRRSTGRSPPASRPAAAPSSSPSSYQQSRASSTHAAPHSQQQQYAPPHSAHPPMQHSAPPPPAMPQSGGGGMLSGIGGMVAQGMALGTGSALGHRAVDAVLGSRHPEPAQATAAAEELVRDNAPCSEQAKAFADCMSYNNGDMDRCEQYFENMQQCRLSLQ